MRFIVFRHAYYEGLGSIAHYIQKIKGTYFYVDIFKNQSPPPAMAINYDALILMGGPQSVNEIDLYPELEKSFEAARLFLACNKPILGICLGAQILAKILGGEVRKSTFEFGFSKVKVVPSFFTEGLSEEIEVFEWHGENFSIPEKAELLFKGEHVLNQGFAFGRCLALQFHLEVHEDLYLAWQQVLERQGKLNLIKEMPLLSDVRRRLKTMEENLFFILDKWLYPARRNLSGI